jgi:anti-sigma B factor antagonist
MSSSRRGRPRQPILAYQGRGTRDLMSYFSTRPESDVLVIAFDNPAALNDFRNSALRDALYEALQAQTEARFAVDLSKVDYLSSSGIAILVGMKRRVDARNGQLVVYYLQPIVRDLLTIMKLDRFFTIADDEERALALFRSLPTA